MTIPATARAIAAKVSHAFTADQELVMLMNAAQRQLCDANRDLWSGVHPDAIALLYGDMPASAIQADGAIRSEVTAVMADALRLTEAGDLSERYAAIETAALLSVQRIHWRIHRAFVDCTRVAEERRQLAADVGELVHELVGVLSAAGWTEEQARNANVHELANDKAEPE
jgi:hypothetical protein